MNPVPPAKNNSWRDEKKKKKPKANCSREDGGKSKRDLKL